MTNFKNQRRQIHINKPNQNNHNDYSEPYLFGKAIERTRRKVPRDNPPTEIVTYLIQSNRDSEFYVDDYAPASYYELGAEVSFPVFIKAYNRKNGERSYMLNIQKMTSSRGKHF